MLNHRRNRSRGLSVPSLCAGPLLFVILSLGWPHTAGAQAPPDLRQQLFTDISDQKLDDFSHIEAAFILSGVGTRDSLQHYLDWYDSLVSRIEGFHFDPIDHVGSAGKIFNYIRTTLYERYEKNATTLLDIVDRKKYNCVSATVLFNYVCESLGMPTEAFETPTHVYTVFSEFGDRIIVENTHPMGFDILKNLNAYSNYLAQFYPQKEIYKIGLDRLYAYENRKGRLIDNTELLGLLAYNQAYFARKRGDYGKAYDMILVAQDFNRDSRSNINLEKELYFDWGKQCFDQRRFHDAFEVLADGVYRYPDEDGLVKNTQAAFFNSLRQYWQGKDWVKSRKIIREMLDLDILNLRDVRSLRSLLYEWRRFFQQIGRPREADEVSRFVGRLSGR